MIRFVDENYESRENVVFWPDLATCHYTKENLEFLKEQNISYVEKKDNPPSAPQICPIKNYWGILKMEVYAGNWQARGNNSREKLIRRVKECQKKIDQNVIIK